jgi:hypothetical protein
MKIRNPKLDPPRRTKQSQNPKFKGSKRIGSVVTTDVARHRFDFGGLII